MLYAFAYHDSLASSGFDGDSYPPLQIAQAWIDAEDKPDEITVETQLSPGNGLPDASLVCQALYYKIRMILVGPLESTDYKQRSLKMHIRSLQQNMWLGEALKLRDREYDFDDLLAYDGEMGLEQ